MPFKGKLFPMSTDAQNLPTQIFKQGLLFYVDLKFFIFSLLPRRLGDGTTLPFSLMDTWWRCSSFDSTFSFSEEQEFVSAVSAAFAAASRLSK